jgi:hypothetical protein
MKHDQRVVQAFFLGLAAGILIFVYAWALGMIALAPR